jgi:hypothetical protein
VWQNLNSRAIPVALDEVEADADNEKKQQVIDLMRQSASGMVLLRGTGEHAGHSFAVYAAFLFSSILVLPLKPADRSRIVMLELGPLPPGKPEPLIDDAALIHAGRAFRRRLMLIWSTLDQHLKPWWDAIYAATGQQRCADVYGIVLAMQHAVLHGLPAEDSDCQEWVPLIALRLRELLTETGRDHDQMLVHLMSQQLETWDKGEKLTGRQLAWSAAGWPIRQADNQRLEADDERSSTLPDRMESDGKRSNAVLVKHGLRVVRIRDGENAGRQFLAVANRSQGLNRLFYRTRWHDGVWSQAAKRVPGSHTRKVRFDGPPELAILVPLETESVLGPRPQLEDDGVP